jgi:hypothetical protein
MKLNKSSHLYERIFSIRGKIAIVLTGMIGWFQVAMAQGDTSPDFMRSIGKIYVVAAVCLIILLTILIFLVILDRKITKLEKRQHHE